jgi:hypothetical protein
MAELPNLSADWPDPDVERAQRQKLENEAESAES